MQTSILRILIFFLLHFLETVSHPAVLCESNVCPFYLAVCFITYLYGKTSFSEIKILLD